MNRWFPAALLLLFMFSTSPKSPLLAQEIYKWEDQNGVVHYSDTPNAPTAKPMPTGDIPYSHTGSLPGESAAERNARIRSERNEARFEKQQRAPRAHPSLSRVHAQLAPNGHLRLFGVIRAKGKSVCQQPAVEVTIFDELGNTDGNFATAARPEAIMGSEEAYFEGDYLTPVGGSFAWDAAPRCSTVDGAVYGAHKRGSLKTTYGRIVRSKKFRLR
jgi:hypothetical protein